MWRKRFPLKWNQTPLDGPVSSFVIDQPERAIEQSQSDRRRSADGRLYSRLFDGSSPVPEGSAYADERNTKKRPNLKVCVTAQFGSVFRAKRLTLPEGCHPKPKAARLRECAVSLRAF